MRRLRLNKDQVYLLDGSNIFYRCFFAPFRNLSTTCGCVLNSGERQQEPQINPECPWCEGTGEEPTKATWLFTKQLLAIIRDKKPKYLAVVFDGNRAALHRREIYPDYKANRKDKPVGSKPQLRRIKQIIRALGIKVEQCDGYEADDALATLATKFAGPEREVIILSRDKDMLQLCNNPDIFRFDPLTAEWVAKATAGKRYGITAEQLVDYFILMGDGGDNVPGVGGFGEKNAAKFLQRYKSIPDMLIAATMGHLPKKLAENLCRANASGWLATARKLITLDTNVAAFKDFTPSDLVMPELNLKRVRSIFHLLDFRNL